MVKPDIPLMRLAALQARIEHEGRHPYLIGGVSGWIASVTAEAWAKELGGILKLLTARETVHD